MLSLLCLCCRLTSSQKDVLLRADQQVSQLLFPQTHLPKAICGCLQLALLRPLRGFLCRGLPTTCGRPLPGPHPQHLSSGELRGHLSSTEWLQEIHPLEAHQG